MENNCFDVEFSLMYHMNLKKWKLLSASLTKFQKGRCSIRKYNVMSFFGRNNANKLVCNGRKKITKRKQSYLYNFRYIIQKKSFWPVWNTDVKASKLLTSDTFTFIFNYEIQFCILTGCIQLGTTYYSNWTNANASMNLNLNIMLKRQLVRFSNKLDIREHHMYTVTLLNFSIWKLNVFNTMMNLRFIYFPIYINQYHKCNY